MKKSLIIIFAIILVSISYYFYRNRIQNYENLSLVNTYKILSSETEWSKKIIPSDNSTSWYVEDKKINIEAKNYDGDFYCGNNKAQFTKYKSYINSNFIGAWSNISVVDCSDYYFVFSYADNGPKLFGPFYK